MKEVYRWNLAESMCRVKVLARGTDNNYQIYGAVQYITEELGTDGKYYKVLHHDSGNTSTFATEDWRVMVERFIDI